MMLISCMMLNDLNDVDDFNVLNKLIINIRAFLLNSTSLLESHLDLAASENLLSPTGSDKREAASLSSPVSGIAAGGINKKALKMSPGRLRHVLEW